MFDKNVSKILVVGPNFYGYTESVARGFESLGLEVRTFNYWEYKPLPLLHPTRWAGSQEDRAQSYQIYVKSMHSELLEACRTFRPNYLVIIKGNRLSEEVLSAISCPKILWMMDSLTRVKETVPLAHLFEKIFVFEKSDLAIPELSRLKTSFLPLALDPMVFKPSVSRRLYDACFVGDLDQRRTDYLSFAAKNLTQHRFEYYGRYLTFSHDNLAQRLSNFFLGREWRWYKNRRIHPKQVNALFNSSKIGINIHHNQSKYGCNQRFFELIGAGTFQIVDDNPFIKENFDGLVATYTTKEELLDRLGYYLRHDFERTKMASRAFATVLGAHTFAHRARTILEF